MNLGSSPTVPFEAHIELLQFFLVRREAIVEHIQALLNAQRRAADRRSNAALSRQFEECFFGLGGLAPDYARLRGHLEAAHWADGFKPRDIPGLHNGLIDPAEMMVRGCHLWRQTHWPGRNGRLRYAHTLFNLYAIRCLALLSMRVWDAGSGGAADRLAQVQGVLDRLWSGAPADQPALVRDARWLIQLAQSPATDDLGAYFEVAERVAGTLPDGDRLELHKAGARMTAGHLRSQIRYHAVKRGVALDEQGLVVSTRTSNALDFALLVQDLVPLLAAYEHAWRSGDGQARLELADAICQGVSPDPELFLNRVELLGPYSMIEHLFVTTGADGHAGYTPMGQRHVRLLDEYESRIARVSATLAEDCPHFRPVPGACSPYGVLYGFSSDLLEHMALKGSLPEAMARFGLEDVFATGDADGRKLAWVSGWRKLPHLTRDVERLFEYPQQFAEDVFERLEQALRRRVADGERTADVRTGRLVVVSGDDLRSDSDASRIPDLPIQYIAASDRQLVAANKARAYDERQLSNDRLEGKYVVSCRVPGGWMAIDKAILTEVLGAGRDAKVVGLPPEAVGVLRLTSPNLVAAPGDLADL